jgi:hypothetical protein
MDVIMVFLVGTRNEGSLVDGSRMCRPRSDAGLGRVMVMTLGVNVAGGVAYVALVDGGKLVDCGPYTVAPGDMLGSIAGLVKFEEDVSRQLSLWGAAKVVILEPETTYKGGYKNFVDRIGIETIFLMSAHRADIPSYRLSRQKVRSILELGRGSTFEVLAAGLLAHVGPHWKNKRDCAALAALAGEAA